MIIVLLNFTNGPEQPVLVECWARTRERRRQEKKNLETFSEVLVMEKFNVVT